jgi:RNA polymerase sigma-70 factor (ECF subfamily)
MAEANPNRKAAARNDAGATPLSLLERLRANDPEGWRRLIDLYQPLVRFWCARAGLGAEDAEDVTQEIFAAAARGLTSFRRDQPGDTFQGWLRGITRNQILLFHRHNRGRPRAAGGSEALVHFRQVEDPLPPPGEEEELQISQVYRRALDQARGEFEERHWQVFWRTVIEGRTAVSVSAELGLTVGNIRQIKSRILRHIKLEVGDLIE